MAECGERLLHQGTTTKNKEWNDSPLRPRKSSYVLHEHRLVPTSTLLSAHPSSGVGLGPLTSSSMAWARKEAISSVVPDARPLHHWLHSHLQTQSQLWRGRELDSRPSGAPRGLEVVNSSQASWSSRCSDCPRWPCPYRHEGACRAQSSLDLRAVADPSPYGLNGKGGVKGLFGENDVIGCETDTFRARPRVDFGRSFSGAQR